MIVLPRGSESGELRSNTTLITNADIASGKNGMFIAGKISDREKYGQPFVIGGGSTQQWGGEDVVYL